MQKKENKKNEDENFAHAVISWDDTANAKTYSNHWKIRLFLFYHFSQFD